MKVIYCPAGQDPMTIARQSRQRRGGAGIVSYWWVGALVVFLALSFTVGPLKPKNGNVLAPIGPDVTPATAEIAINSALVNAFDGYCKNPAGGMIAPGDTAYLTDGEQIKKVRCDNGTFTEEGTAATP